MHPKAPLVLMLFFLGLGMEPVTALASTVTITVTDEDTGKRIPCRVHLVNSVGQAVQPKNWPFWHDHFVCNGRVTVRVDPGSYVLQIERGPEYAKITTPLTVAPASNQKLEATLKRLVNMASENWWSGELHVHRSKEHIELIMQAEDIHVAPVITWWNMNNLWKGRRVPVPATVHFDETRYYDLMAGEDEREGGALLYFHLNRPLRIARARREYPSPMKYVIQAKKRHHNAWIDVEKPFWWDMPTWIASGLIDSIGLANNHMCRDQMLETEAWGKARDIGRLPAPLGNGWWSQEIYYHLLNCDIRIPPSAGSASGVLPNPVGYNRVYVHVERPFNITKWWESLRSGRSFVTNGPLLQVQANGQHPGHVFSIDEHPRSLNVQLSCELVSRDLVGWIEVIKNGVVVSRESFSPQEGSLKQNAPQPAAIRLKTELPLLEFKSNGWFLVRVVIDNPATFRFASTAPFFVERKGHPRRVSKTSAWFFLEWVRQRIQRIDLAEGPRRTNVLSYHEEAVRYWQDLVDRANVD